ncbi:hypothetical protein [Sporichthya sp.]|uniref:hypothetical protein n=1 Tax=Sporichthya sp. TaxID=65475 RepID=UPI00185C74FD|nr:hypothetical protein [Sporichthya sp.]MBA3741473.1 hypothetical protein [Sporichthya sp.]
MSVLRSQWDRIAASVAIGAGLLCLIFGYLGISGTAHVAKQLPYIISGGLMGVFLLGLGAMLWLSADMLDEWRELRGMRLLLAEDVALRGEDASLLASAGIRRSMPLGDDEPAAALAGTPRRRTSFASEGSRAPVGSTSAKSVGQ